MNIVQVFVRHRARHTAYTHAYQKANKMGNVVFGRVFLFVEDNARVLQNCEWTDAVDIVIISRWAVNFRLYNMDLLLFFSPVFSIQWDKKKTNEEKRSSVENGVRLSNAWVLRKRKPKYASPFVQLDVHTEQCIPQTPLLSFSVCRKANTVSRARVLCEGSDSVSEN